MSVLCVRKEKERIFTDVYHPEIFFSPKSSHKIFAHAGVPVQTEILPTTRALFAFLLSKKKRFGKRIGEVDDTKSRANIWRALFGDEQMPSIEKNAVEKYAGMLDKYISPDLSIEKIVEKVRKS